MFGREDEIAGRLAELVGGEGAPAKAARHVLLAPGKRVRAVLTLLCAEHCGGRAPDALDAACAVEMVHTASLIFDDLPSMDDASLRRGRVTIHVEYGEDVAILAGIGLLNGAFGVLARAAALDDAQRVATARSLSRATGWSGLVDGQAKDLEGHADAATVHHGKTGVLFLAAAECGAICAPGGGVERLPNLRRYAAELGLAYQAYDDLLDAASTEEAAGKSVRRDSDGTGLVRKLGYDEARARAQHHADAACAAAGEETRLAELIRTVARSFEAKLPRAAASSEFRRA